MPKHDPEVHLMAAERLSDDLLKRRPREADGAIEVTREEFLVLAEGMAAACRPRLGELLLF